MTDVIVRVLPRGFDREYKKIIGENIFCDLWDPQAYTRSREKETCSGVPEIELVIKGERGRAVHLCREHAGYLVEQIAEAIKLVDAGDLMSWTPDET